MDINNRNQCQTSTRKFNAKNKNIRNTYQRAAKIAPRRPKSTQEQPKTPSRRPKSLPKRAQEPPGAAQDLPKTTQDPPKSPLKTVLGPSWDHQTTRSKTRRFRCNSSNFFGTILEPKMLPKTTPKRVQNESKIKTKNASPFYRFLIRLGPVLRRSWARLGVKIKGQKPSKT